MKKKSARHRAAVGRAIAEALEPCADLSAVTFAARVKISIAGANGTAGQFSSTVAADFNGTGRSITPRWTLPTTSWTSCSITGMARSGRANRCPPARSRVAAGGDVEQRQRRSPLRQLRIFDRRVVHRQRGWNVQYHAGNFLYGQAQGNGTVTPAAVAAADVTGNGNQDIILGTSNDVLITFLNQGNDQFQETVAVAGELGAVGQFFTTTSFANDVVGALPTARCRFSSSMARKCRSIPPLTRCRVHS